MVLCVVAIHRPPPQKDDKGVETPVLPHLELTDGWYRILAQLDDCLARAVDRGKIAVGRKISITGARLGGGADGAEVLDAFEKSRLILSGNSTSLARWDVKLGMQSLPFVATLSSLSRDGGIITRMDVVVDKIFPLAFRNADWSVKEGEWDQEEETKRQNKWKVSLLVNIADGRNYMKRKPRSCRIRCSKACSRFRIWWICCKEMSRK